MGDPSILLVQCALPPFCCGGRAAALPLRLVSRILIRLIPHASEAVGICRVADGIPGHLRERTKGSLELDAACRSVVHVMRGNDLLRRAALFYPAFESLQ